MYIRAYPCSSVVKILILAKQFYIFFAMEIPLLDLKAQYNLIREEIREALARLYERQEFILGVEVEGFERELANYIKVDYATGVASGSDAVGG